MQKLVAALRRVLGSFDEYSTKKWVHYTDINKLGVNPKQFHQDIAGIYLFPEYFKTSGTIWKQKKYKITVSLKPNTKILDLSKTTEDDRKNILDKLSIPYIDQDAYNTADNWWEHLKNYYILNNYKKSGKWNKDFRSIGYDAIFDDTGSIYVTEIQLVVLNPSILKVEDVETQNIKRGRLSRLQETQKILSDLLEAYGTIKIEPAKKYRDYSGEDSRLKARLLFTVGEKYIEWEIEEDDSSQEIWVRTLGTNLESFRDNWGTVKMSTRLQHKDVDRLKEFVVSVMKKANYVAK